MDNKKIMTVAEFLSILKDKNIKLCDLGWNPQRKTLGYCKEKPSGYNSYIFNFYYFEISTESILVECPRGFARLRGYKIEDFDSLLTLLFENENDNCLAINKRGE